jgi:hypothetical protein
LESAKVLLLVYDIEAVSATLSEKRHFIVSGISFCQKVRRSSLRNIAKIANVTHGNLLAGWAVREEVIFSTKVKYFPDVPGQLCFLLQSALFAHPLIFTLLLLKFPVLENPVC